MSQQHGRAPKRWIAWLLVLLLLMLGLPSWAKGYQEAATAEMTDPLTGQTAQYTVVNLMVGATDIISDVPGIIYPYNGSERTLVPIRAVAEGLGAKVSWDATQQLVTILYGKKNIVLAIDSENAKVNGSVMALPDGVPAKNLIYDGASRTLVPIKFITDQLGLKSHWNASTSTVAIYQAQQVMSQMVYSNKGAVQEILVQTTGPVQPAVYTVAPARKSDPHQLVFELPNTLLRYSDPAKLDKNGKAVLGIYDRGLKKIEAQQLANEAVPKLKLTLSMDMARGYEVIREAKGFRIRLINTVKSFYEDEIQGAKTVVVRTSESPTYNVVSKGKQVIVDILDTKLGSDVSTSAVVEVGDGGIASYQYSQGAPTAQYGKDKPYTRLVVNLDREDLQDHVYVDDAGDQLFVYVSKYPIGNFYYGKDGVSTAMLSLLGQGKVRYESLYNKATRELRIQVPEAFAYLNDFETLPNDQLVERLTVTRSKGLYDIRILLAEGVAFEDRGKGSGNGGIEFSFKRQALESTVAQNTQKGKLIVIDAGHGGKDPGAISKINGLKEKDLVLPIALKMKQRLEALGFRVYLTRDYDTYIGLYSRADIANSLKADAFVSLHANSAVQEAQGVEMLYAPDQRDSLSLAKRLQQALLQATGARDRGIVPRANLAVLKRTEMPAVLAEIGFLSNPSEVSRLATSEYRQRIVEGLTQGIANYFQDK